MVCNNPVHPELGAGWPFLGLLRSDQLLDRAEHQQGVLPASGPLEGL